MSRYLADIKAWIEVDRGATPSEHQVSRAIYDLLKSDTMNICVNLPYGKFESSRLEVSDVELTVRNIT